MHLSFSRMKSRPFVEHLHKDCGGSTIHNSLGCRAITLPSLQRAIRAMSRISRRCHLSQVSPCRRTVHHKQLENLDSSGWWTFFYLLTNESSLRPDDTVNQCPCCKCVALLPLSTGYQRGGSRARTTTVAADSEMQTPQVLVRVPGKFAVLRPKNRL